MASITYTARRNLETTGFLKSGTDLTAQAADDSLDAVTTNLSGLLTDQWLQVAGFARSSGYYQVKSNSSSSKALTLTPPVTHLRLPGVSGNYASTPDSAANSVTGDLELVVRVALVDWTPAAISTLIAKWNTTGNQRSYALSVNTDGTLNLSWSNDGTAVLSKNSTAAVAFVDGTIGWVRATLDVNNGAAGNDVKFYTSLDGTTWTQLGATVTTGGTTAVFNSTAVLEVGSMITGTSQLAIGRVYYASLTNGLLPTGTIVAAFDPTLATRGASSFVSNTSETWTINTSGTPPALLQGPRIFDEGAEYLRLPGVSGNDATTPDSAAVSVTGDIDIRARISPDSYAPPTNNEIVSKSATDATQFSYLFRHEITTGTFALFWSANGTTLLEAHSTTGIPAASGTIKWVRVTLDVNNGAAGRDIKFFTSDDYDPVTGAGTWTQLGTTVTQGGTTSIFDGTAALRVGSCNTASDRPFTGKIYYAEVRNGLDGKVVAAFDPGRAASGATSLVAYTGETWTINTSGSPVAALVRTTTVTLTGLKRGYGQVYSLDFGVELATMQHQVQRSQQVALGGGQPEVITQREDQLIQVRTGKIDETALAQLREILSSVNSGEVFTFDRYGTIAAPVEPLQVVLESTNYDEIREGSFYPSRYTLSFQLRLV